MMLYCERRNFFWLAAVILTVGAVFQGVSTRAEEPEVPSIIAFGSCAHQNRKQPIWESVVAAKPELFLFLGDNIYGDTTDMEILRGKYAQLGAKKGFQKLLETCPVMAVWDDHDYGLNDAGVEFVQKVASQKVFLEFWGEVEGSPRWERDGVYTARIFDGGEGRRLQVILLDTRFSRSPLTRDPNARKHRYLPDGGADKTQLGDAQWKWLEEQLKKPADLRLLCTSIQAIPEQHPFEKWANFPLERERLFALIGSTGAGGVILMSGDRHVGEISLLPATGSPGAGYPLYEITSSGLTQAGGGYKEKNRWRIG